jgi:hypothetical protein
LEEKIRCNDKKSDGIHIDTARRRDLEVAEQNRAAAKRQRAEFIRQAVKEAIRRREYEQIREAYLRQPDSCSDADEWSNAEQWRL